MNEFSEFLLKSHVLKQNSKNFTMELKHFLIAPSKSNSPPSSFHEPLIIGHKYILRKTLPSFLPIGSKSHNHISDGAETHLSDICIFTAPHSVSQFSQKVMEAVYVPALSPNAVQWAFDRTAAVSIASKNQSIVMSTCHDYKTHILFMEHVP